MVDCTTNIKIVSTAFCFTRSRIPKALGITGMYDHARYIGRMYLAIV